MTSLFITFNPDGTIKTLSVGQGFDGFGGNPGTGTFPSHDILHRLNKLERIVHEMATKEQQLSDALVALDQVTTKLGNDIAPILAGLAAAKAQNADLSQQLADNGITDENLAAAQAAVTKLQGTLTTVDDAGNPIPTIPPPLASPVGSGSTSGDSSSEASDSPASTDPTNPTPDAAPGGDPGIPTDPPPFDPPTDPSAPIVEPIVDNGGDPTDPNTPVPTP